MSSCAQTPVPIVVTLPFLDPVLKQPKEGKCRTHETAVGGEQLSMMRGRKLCYPERHVRLGQSEAFRGTRLIEMI